MNLSDKEWKELRKLLNKAWDTRDERGYYKVFRHKDERQRALYRHVSKILKEAQAVEWSKLSKPDNVEANDG